MKTFLKMLLATVLGGLVLMFIFFIFFGIFVSALSLSDKEVVVEQNSILTLDVNNVIYERAEDDPFSGFNPLSGKPENAIGLNNILKAIEAAKDDERISALFLNGGIPLTGAATLKEIRNAILDFKESGKKVYSYSEIMTQKGLYLASVADSILMNPEGFMEWKGLSISVSYYKDALDKLGLKPVVLRATGNKFKSAVEPYMLQEMSEANRLQLTQLLSSVWSDYLGEVADSRSQSVEHLNEVANKFAVTSPREAVDYGLIDETAYKDQLLEHFESITSSTAIEDIPFIGVSSYLDGTNTRKGTAGSDKIAVIIAQGEIVDGKGNEYSIGSKRISSAIRKARLNDKIKAVVLRVNSPGGSALASEVIWREVALTKEVKPVVASMGDLAASGGYYISCFADTIVANSNTITGSIGAFGLFFTGEELMHDKLGINIETVKTNEYSDLGTFDRSLTETEQALLIHQVDKVYGTFKNRVAEGRGLDVNYVDSIGQGRVWSGSDALELGLVDVIGDLNTAISIAADMAELEEYRIVEYPKLEDPIERLLEDLTGGYKARVIQNSLGEYGRYFDFYQKAMSMQGYQTHMGYEIVID